MANNPTSTGSGPRGVNEVDIEEAFLDIPDSENEAIADARRTYLYTVWSAAVFIAVVFVFIL
jgi:hypothetical protein